MISRIIKLNQNLEEECSMIIVVLMHFASFINEILNQGGKFESSKAVDNLKNYHCQTFSALLKAHEDIKFEFNRKSGLLIYFCAMTDLTKAAISAFSPTPTGWPTLAPNSTSNLPTGFPTSMPSTGPTPFNMYFNENSQLMLGSSIASCLGALSIMIIYASNADLRKKTYIQIIFWSSLSDFFGAVATSLGYLEDGTGICAIQGIASNVFPLARVFWTVIITYLMYTIIVRAKPMTVTTPIHITLWSLSTIPTLLVYTTNRIGALDGPGWCFIAARSDSPAWGLLFWTFFSFYIWIIASLVIMGGLLTLITIHFAKSKISTMQSSNNKLANVNKLWVYPAIIFFCWLAPAIVDTQLAITDGEVEPYPLQDYVTYLTLVLPLSQGFLTAVVFFTSTHALRLKTTKSFKISVALLVKQPSLKYIGSAMRSMKVSDKSITKATIKIQGNISDIVEMKV
eukprot:gene6989-14213_t